MEDSIYTQIGKRIRTARQLKNITQTELGKKLSPPVTATAISLYESGEREPSLNVIISIADVLGVTKEYLINGINEPTKITPIHLALRADKHLKNNGEAQKEILNFIEYVKKRGK